MKDLKSFDIAIFGLKNKTYSFDFEGDSSFFALFENSLVEKGTFKARVEMDRSETMLQMRFHITGTVELVCDRSLEPFQHPLDISEGHILKFGTGDQVLSDEIEIIDRDTTVINVAQYIYEFIGLAVPMKKIHPDLAGRQYEESEEGLLIYRSKPDGGEPDPEEETDVDPRWAALRKLSDN